MRSKDYNNYQDSFTPLAPNEMARLALVEGIKGKYPHGERLRYKRLLHKFLNMKNQEIDELFRLYTRHHNPDDNFYGPRDETMNDLINKVSYNSPNWKPINYGKLKDEGVIIQYDGSRAGLVELLENIDQRKLISCREPIIQGDRKEYLKHVPQQKKMPLNGPDVIMDFARKYDFYHKLPSSLTKQRRITNPVKDLLKRHHFTFTEALRTCIDQTLKSEKYANRDVRLFTVKNPNGSELRLHQYNPVESAEHFVNIRMRRDMGDDTQWIYTNTGNDEKKKLNPAVLYYGLNTFLVPKRIPSNEGYKTHNTLETHFLPDAGSKNVLEYFNTFTQCNCPHALNLRNFQERRGSKTYIIPTFDIHAGVANLEILAQKGIDARDPDNAPNNLSPLPTEENVSFLDKAKYNLIIDTSPRKYADKLTIDMLANERTKLRSFSELYGPDTRLINFTCRSMYFE